MDHLWQKTSFFSARISLITVNRSSVGLSVLAAVSFMVTIWWFLPLPRVSEVFAYTTWSNAKSGSLFSSALSSFPVVKSHDSSPGAWCFISAGWMVWKSNFDKGRFQRARRPVQSERLSLHLSALWSVWSVKCWSLNYGRRIITRQIMARLSFSPVSYHVLVLVSECDQEPVGFIMLSAAFEVKRSRFVHFLRLCRVSCVHQNMKFSTLKMIPVRSSVNS